jgi:hypothetical protein
MRELVSRRSAFTRYGSFLPPLRALCAVDRPATVIEFGSGYISTGFFLELGADVVALEMCSREWCERIRQRFAGNAALTIRMTDSNAYELVAAEDMTANLGLVDGHPDTRPACVTALFGRCPVILAHDYDLRPGRYAGVETASGYEFLLFDRISPQTGIWIAREHPQRAKMKQALMNAPLF